MKCYSGEEFVKKVWWKKEKSSGRAQWSHSLDPVALHVFYCHTEEELRLFWIFGVKEPTKAKPYCYLHLHLHSCWEERREFQRWRWKKGLSEVITEPEMPHVVCLLHIMQDQNQLNLYYCRQWKRLSEKLSNGKQNYGCSVSSWFKLVKTQHIRFFSVFGKVSKKPIKFGVLTKIWLSYFWKTNSADIASYLTLVI